MRAIDRTTTQFVASVKEALPDVYMYVQKSVAKHGRSNYIYIHLPKRLRPLKVRISDHPVGMRRALWGEEDLFIHHLAKPASWAVWIGETVRSANRS